MALVGNQAPCPPSLEEFDRANSAPGLLLRFARGRIRTVHFRFVVIFVGVGLLAAFVNLPVALFMLAIMALFEGVEYTVLRRFTRLAYIPENMGPVITLISFLQALGIGVSIFIVAISGDTPRLAAWVFLIGVTLNSLLVARYHPASHRARITVYLLTVGAIIAHQIFVLNLNFSLLVTEAVSFALLVYMFVALFRHLSRREQKMLLAERQLIQQSQEIRDWNTKLEHSQKILVKQERKARRLALVAEHATDSVILTDQFSTILWVNAQFTRITGYSMSEAVGHPVGDLLNGPSTDQKTIAKIQRAGQARQPVQCTILNYCKDGSTIWMQVSQTPVFDKQGRFQMFISVERDATQTIQRQAELQKALNTASQADKDKTDFLARMSHELRTPANGIVGGLDLLVETLLTPEQQAIASILEQGANRMTVLVDNILNFSELANDRLDIRKEPVDLPALLKEVIKRNRPTAQSKGLQGPTLHLPDTSLPKVMSDPQIMGRIFCALIDNAVKFTECGEIDIFLRLIPQGKIQALTVEIRDTGLGVSKVNQSRIFENFTQVDENRTREHDGAGLGLAIALASAQRLDGTITLRPNTPHGSIFTVELPLQSTSQTTPPQNAGFLRNPDLTILVAEDNKTNRMVLSKMFKDTKVRLEFANDGVQAVEKYEVLRPDLVLMDVAMPFKDGLQATREIRQFEKSQRLPTCPIVALTANSFASDRKNCFEAGMTAFLPKPVRKQKLIAALDSALHPVIAKHTAR